ncbi:MAG: type VII toxin-antitoxin system HepT family RNase toxin [Myxococcota bacterium]
MVRRELIGRKLADVHRRLDNVRRLRPEEADALERDEDLLDLVSFNLMLAVQACVDAASHIIADEGWPQPTTLRGAFDTLAREDVVSRETAAAMGRAAAFRNVVAHGYVEVVPALVYEAATDGLDELSRFAREVAAWIRDHAD